jgi:hypothetical protein
MRRAATTFARAQVAVCHWFNPSIAHQSFSSSEAVFSDWPGNRELFVNSRTEPTDLINQFVTEIEGRDIAISSTNGPGTETLSRC